MSGRRCLAGDVLLSSRLLGVVTAEGRAGNFKLDAELDLQKLQHEQLDAADGDAEQNWERVDWTGDTDLSVCWIDGALVGLIKHAW